MPTIKYAARPASIDVTLGLFTTSAINPSLNTFGNIVIGGWGGGQWAIRVGLSGTILCPVAAGLFLADGWGSYYVQIFQTPLVSGTTMHLTVGYINAAQVMVPIISYCSWPLGTPFRFGVFSSWAYAVVYTNVTGMSIFSDPGLKSLNGVVSVPAGDFDHFLSTPTYIVGSCNNELNKSNAHIHSPFTYKHMIEMCILQTL